LKFYIQMLKGQCQEIFCLRLFSLIIFPQGPENTIRIISIFLENFLANLQLVSPTPMVSFDPSTTGVVDVDGKFATGVNY
jgi:hypothetical protein